jgi:hypothetical protein
VENPAIAGFETLGTGRVAYKPCMGDAALRVGGVVSPLQGSRLGPSQPRAPAGFAASALGFPVPRFQRYGRCSCSIIKTAVTAY